MTQEQYQGTLRLTERISAKLKNSSPLFTIVNWINSCKTYEQVLRMEEYVNDNYLVVPACFQVALSNKKTLLACNL